MASVQSRELPVFEKNLVIWKLANAGHRRGVGIPDIRAGEFRIRKVDLEHVETQEARMWCPVAKLLFTKLSPSLTAARPEQTSFGAPTGTDSRFTTSRCVERFNHHADEVCPGTGSLEDHLGEVGPADSVPSARQPRTAAGPREHADRGVVRACRGGKVGMLLPHEVHGHLFGPAAVYGRYQMLRVLAGSTERIHGETTDAAIAARPGHVERVVL